MLRIEKSEESNIELNCSVNGDPMPLIQWSFNSIPLYGIKFFIFR